jgi:hypothetical protein
MKVVAAKSRIHRGPAIHPNCATDHAKDSTPAPITPVIICATALHTLPDKENYLRTLKKYVLFNYFKNISHFFYSSNFF